MDNNKRITQEQLEQIAERYRRGIAEFLGVPPEAIRKDIALKWAEHYVKAFTYPEYWPEHVHEMGKISAELVEKARRRW